MLTLIPPCLPSVTEQWEESHSIENKAGGIRQRNNPAWNHDSLTRHEHAFIKNPEEISCEDILANKKGYNRSYSTTGCAASKTSTPAVLKKNEQFIESGSEHQLRGCTDRVTSKAEKARHAHTYHWIKITMRYITVWQVLKPNHETFRNNNGL